MFTDAMRVCIDQRELFGKPYAKKITDRPWVNLNVIMLLPHFIKLADQKVSFSFDIQSHLSIINVVILRWPSREPRKKCPSTRLGSSR